MAKKEEKKVAEKVTKKEKKEKNANKNSGLKGIKTELKKVTWPTPKELVNKTIAVIVSVLIVALIVFVLDVVFKNVYNLGTKGLKSLVGTSSSEVVSEDTTDASIVEEGTLEGDTTVEVDSTEEVTE